MTARSLIPLFLSFSQISIANSTEELEPLIISTPLHKKVAETLHPINILSGDNLTLKQASTIGETLKQELGIHNMSFGANVGQPVIRGQMGVRVQVLQNGLSSLDASGVSPDHANSTSPLLAEQIEVLRGPASLLYGSGAIGGIVNIIDNRIPTYVPESSQTSFEQRYNSSSNLWNSALKHKGGTGNLAWYIDGFFHSNDNVSIPKDSNGLDYVDNTDAQSWSGTLGSSWVDDWGMLGFSVNYLDNNYGVPSNAEEEEEDHDDDDDDHDDDHDDGDHDDGGHHGHDSVRIDLKQIRYDLKAELHDPFSGIETLKFRFAYNDYEHAELEKGLTVGTQYDNQGIEARLEAVHKPFAFIDHGAWGFQAQHKKLTVSGDEAFFPASEIQNYAFFMVEDMHFGDIAYELGLRVEQQNISAVGFSNKHHTPVSASLSALWNATDNSFLSLAFTHSQRAPNVQELFSFGEHFATQSYELGDENLKLETSYNLEFSFKSDFDWVNTELNVFHNWSKNYITQENTGKWFDHTKPTNESIVTNCANSECLAVYQTEQQDARFYGFEAQLGFPLWQNSEHQFSVDLFSDFVRGKLSSGNNVPRMPPLRYGLQFNYAGLNAWESTLRLTRAESQKYAGENDSQTPGYLLLDIGINYTTRIADKVDALVFIKANNLLNETIRNSTSMIRDIAPEAGRGAEIGFRVDF